MEGFLLLALVQKVEQTAHLPFGLSRPLACLEREFIDYMTSMIADKDPLRVVALLRFRFL